MGGASGKRESLVKPTGILALFSETVMHYFDSMPLGSAKFTLLRAQKASKLHIRFIGSNLPDCKTKSV